VAAKKYRRLKNMQHQLSNNWMVLQQPFPSNGSSTIFRIKRGRGGGDSLAKSAEFTLFISGVRGITVVEIFLIVVEIIFLKSKITISSNQQSFIS
jgi:hypothetical protein